MLAEAKGSVGIDLHEAAARTERIDLGKGYCGALVSKYFRANLAQ